MQAVGVLRRSLRAVRAPTVSLFDRFLSPEALLASSEASAVSFSKSRFLSTYLLHNHAFSVSSTNQCGWQSPPRSMFLTATFCSAPDQTNSGATEAVKEVYDKMLHSVKKMRSAPPNAWMWTLIENCKNKEDIKLLFNILQNLRRLSNLRIHDNFNCNLCQQITKTCIRVGAIDFGLKALWKHNVYGLSPSVASANSLLSYAKKQKDPELMSVILKLIKRNDLPLQPSTADIVFSICLKTDKWELISKYSKRFQKAGVKLRKVAFGSWMEFAAKRGDVEALWKVEKLRSDVYKNHNLESGFACAKGLLLERKPEDAASMIQALNQTFPDSKSPQVLVQIQKLVSEWPSEVLKHQKEQDRKDLANALKQDIPAMVNFLVNNGVEANDLVEE
ncbi:hypothetical protein V2J09_013726 [Rumex salicifolius]